MIDPTLLAELHESIEGDTLTVSFDTILSWTVKDDALSPTAAYAVSKETALELIRRMEANIASRSGFQPIPTAAQ